MAFLAQLPPPPPQPVRIFWTGISGLVYEFQLDPIGTAYHAFPGVYIFCRLAPDGLFHPLYVGETESFYARLTDQLRLHHCWQRVCAAGATHISTLYVPGNLAARESIETDLRRGTQAPLNRQ
jgi:hypothetical protein